MEADGFYFDDSGALAAFDTELTQGINSVVVRKDIIDAFLNETGMKLVWLVMQRKTYIPAILSPVGANGRLPCCMKVIVFLAHIRG